MNKQTILNILNINSLHYDNSKWLKYRIYFFKKISSIESILQQNINIILK
jgi:hypothetical protein